MSAPRWAVKLKDTDNYRRIAEDLAALKKVISPVPPLGEMAPWFRVATPLYKNTGSVARDHLASERTFLAWIRTGLGFVALGIAIERFSQLDLEDILSRSSSSSSVGVNAAATTAESRERKLRDEAHSHLLVGALMALGSGSILYGTARYFTNMRLLERGEFKPAYHGAAVTAAAVAGLAGGVFGSAVGRRRSKEREDMER